MSTPEDIYVSVGAEMVSIRRKGRTTASVARILGCESDPDGQVRRIYLDRLVHAPHEQRLGEWQAHGCVSTILTR
jgi:hypothetical protein